MRRVDRRVGALAMSRWCLCRSDVKLSEPFIITIPLCLPSLNGAKPGHGTPRCLLGPLLSLTSRPKGRLPESRVLRRLAQARLFRHARADIDARLREVFCVKDLCDRLEVSRRSLEYLLHNHAGVSPAEYVRLTRLNHIRRHLLQPNGAGRSMGDVAAEYGIWHLGHLAQEYGQTFDELPSRSKQIAKRQR